MHSVWTTYSWQNSCWHLQSGQVSCAWNKCGLVLRLKPAKDQRRVFLKLTAAGRQLYTQAHHRINACQQQLAHDFSPKKLNQLHELLQELNTLAKRKSEQAEEFKS